MFYTELDPYTLEKVYVAKTSKDKSMQRALMRYFAPESRDLVLEALKKAKRFDLIGNSENCLIKGNSVLVYKTKNKADAKYNSSKGKNYGKTKRKKI